MEQKRALSGQQFHLNNVEIHACWRPNGRSWLENSLANVRYPLDLLVWPVVGGWLAHNSVDLICFQLQGKLCWGANCETLQEGRHFQRSHTESTALHLKNLPFQNKAVMLHECSLLTWSTLYAYFTKPLSNQTSNHWFGKRGEIRGQDDKKKKIDFPFCNPTFICMTLKEIVFFWKK